MVRFNTGKRNNFELCNQCAKQKFTPVSTKTQSLSDSPVLLWESIDENSTWDAVEVTLNECVTKPQAVCASLSIFPQTICSEHKVFLQKTEGLNEERNFLPEQTTDELWPSIRIPFQGHGLRAERAVLLVNFETKHAEKCLRCMVTRSGVFFAFPTKGYHLGYIWMTQNQASLVQACQEEHVCGKVWFMEDLKHFIIRDGMRPLSIHDIAMLFK